MKNDQVEYKEQVTLRIPDINLKWTKWYSWNTLKENANKTKIAIPNTEGVYEVKLEGEKERLTIGKSTRLRTRIKTGLMGNGKHSTGEKIVKHEDLNKIFIRWSETDRPAAAEEELHRKYLEKHSTLPKYTQRT